MYIRHEQRSETITILILLRKDLDLYVLHYNYKDKSKLHDFRCKGVFVDAFMNSGATSVLYFMLPKFKQNTC